MENNKLPGNDGHSKEFYEYFLGEIKKLFIASIDKTFLNHELGSSQNEALIKLEKKTKDSSDILICLIQIRKL